MKDFFSDFIDPSPLQRLHDDLLDAYEITLFLKRDDQIQGDSRFKISDSKTSIRPKFETSNLKSEISNLEFPPPSVSGNKFRKLRYNLVEMQRLGLRCLVTFGGAFSNHIHAVAAAGAMVGVETVGIIRGEKTDLGNPTLRFAQKQGMELRFVSRSDYRDKAQLVTQLTAELGDFYLLPEGGTNIFAIRGSAETALEVETQLGSAPDFLCAPCGTGGTLAGLIVGASLPTRILGFSALKGDFLTAEVTELLSEFCKTPQNTEGGGDSDFGWRVSDFGTTRVPKSEISHLKSQNPPPQYFEVKNINWQIQTDYHFGGYARFTPELIDFINFFKQKHQIALDPIYTGKMLFGIYDLVKKGFFPKWTTIVAVHTGGLQGIEGFNQRFGTILS
jgi:1-aminocyclopropane-1-carboxylate deaminase